MRTGCGGIAGLLLALSVSSVLAKPGAHTHGRVQLNVSVEAKVLTFQLEAPLESLLGFEHAPRTAAQKAAAQAVLQRTNDGASLIAPEAAAMCALKTSTVHAPVLQATVPSSDAGRKDAEHGDLEATIVFICEKPERLTTVELGLMDAFKRIQTIDVQVVTSKGQTKQTLKRPAKTLRLGR